MWFFWERVGRVPGARPHPPPPFSPPTHARTILTWPPSSLYPLSSGVDASGTAGGTPPLPSPPSSPRLATRVTRLSRAPAWAAHRSRAAAQARGPPAKSAVSSSTSSQKSGRPSTARHDRHTHARRARWRVAGESDGVAEEGEGVGRRPRQGHRRAAPARLPTPTCPPPCPPARPRTSRPLSPALPTASPPTRRGVKPRQAKHMGQDVVGQVVEGQAARAGGGRAARQAWGGVRARGPGLGGFQGCACAMCGRGFHQPQRPPGRDGAGTNAPALERPAGTAPPEYGKVQAAQDDVWCDPYIPSPRHPRPRSPKRRASPLVGPAGRRSTARAAGTRPHPARRVEARTAMPAALRGGVGRPARAGRRCCCSPDPRPTSPPGASPPWPPSLITAPSPPRPPPRCGDQWPSR